MNECVAICLSPCYTVSTCFLPQCKWQHWIWLQHVGDKQSKRTNKWKVKRVWTKNCQNVIAFYYFFSSSSSSSSSCFLRRCLFIGYWCWSHAKLADGNNLFRILCMKCYLEIEALKICRVLPNSWSEKYSLDLCNRLRHNRWQISNKISHVCFPFRCQLYNKTLSQKQHFNRILFRFYSIPLWKTIQTLFFFLCDCFPSLFFCG